MAGLREQRCAGEARWGGWKGVHRGKYERRHGRGAAVSVSYAFSSGGKDGGEVDRGEDEAWVW